MTATFIPPGLSRRPAGAHADPSDAAAARQRAVDQLNLVGTAPEERFDRLTRLAAQVFGVDKALVALADGDRLWLKSEQGVGQRSFPLDETMCRHVVEGGDATQPLVVPDAASDPRFDAVPSVRDGDVRFYAGAPLVDGSGIVVGTFCVANSTPKQFSATDQALLDELAGWAQAELIRSTENFRAREVQRLLMPADPTLPGYELAATCVPSLSVGGDFYDWEAMDAGLGFVLADVMGKGAAAAIMSANVRAAFRSALRRDLERRRARDTAPRVDAMMDHTARILGHDLTTTAMLATAFAGMLYPAEHTLTWVDAGHALAVLVPADGAARWLEGDDLPLGVLDGHTWRQHDTRLAPGDSVVVFSDGLLDLVGGGRRGLADIVELVRRAAGPADLVAQVEVLTEIGIAGDDVTVLALRRSA